MSAREQLGLFEPEAGEVERLAQGYRRESLRATDSAELWHACLAPGLRDAAEREADAAMASWLVCAIFLDLTREAGEGAL